MSITQITQQIDTLPTPPSISDPSSFDERADSFLGKLVTFGEQISLLISKLNIFRDEANQLGNEITENREAISVMKEETQQARDEVLGAAASLPEGIVNNGSVSDIDTYSSSKIRELTATNCIEVSSDYTASVGDYIFLNTTTASCNITLPATSNNFSVVKIFDYMGSFELNTPTVIGNGNLVMGLDESLELNVNNRTYEFIYINGDWRLS